MFEKVVGWNILLKWFIGVNNFFFQIKIISRDCYLLRGINKEGRRVYSKNKLLVFFD